MKNELEKCLSGEWYDCHAPVFMGFKRKTHELLLKYNSLSYECKEEKYAILKEMFESIGKKVSVGHSFICDYGCNISIGNNVSINTGCTFVDCNKIIIGNNVLIAPNVQIYTATHPVDLNERLTPTETESGTAISVTRMPCLLPLRTVVGLAAVSLSCRVLLSVGEALSGREVLSPNPFRQTALP